MDIVWDPAKAKSNAAKHGICFADVEPAFYDEFALSMPDQFSTAEERFLLVGRDALGRIITVSYTYRSDDPCTDPWGNCAAQSPGTSPVCGDGVFGVVAYCSPDHYPDCGRVDDSRGSAAWDSDSGGRDRVFPSPAVGRCDWAC